MNTTVEATTTTTSKRRRRPNAARVQIRLTTAEKAELTAATQRAGYVHLARYLLDLHRGRVGPSSPLDTGAVRSAVEAVAAVQAEKTAADLAALAEQVVGLREATKENFGRLAEHLKALAARLPSPPVRPAGSGSTAPRVGGQS
jgi:hypothetical protein